MQAKQDSRGAGEEEQKEDVSEPLNANLTQNVIVSPPTVHTRARVHG